MTVNYETYMNDKKAFLNKHHNDWEVTTSPMNEYGCYYKWYVCKDGAIWYESMSPEYESTEVEVEIKMVKVKTTVEVKMLRTEYFSSDDAKSNYYYEKF